MTVTSPTQSYFDELRQAVSLISCEEMDAALDLIRKAWQEDRQVITMGNGGSAMTALHFATDWGKGVFEATGRPFRARTLLDNLGILTAYSNDLSYAEAFSSQIRNISRPGDLVIAISGSGNSRNVLQGIQAANDFGCITLGLCGFSGGELRKIAQHVVWIRSEDMQICEDLHSMFGHIVMKALCREA